MLLPAYACLPACLCGLLCHIQVNSDLTTIQELQVSPGGVITMIYPNNTDTNSRLGINIFQQVIGVLRVCYLGVVDLGV